MNLRFEHLLPQRQMSLWATVDLFCGDSKPRHCAVIQPCLLLSVVWELKVGKLHFSFILFVFVFHCSCLSQSVCLRVCHPVVFPASLSLNLVGMAFIFILEHLPFISSFTPQVVSAACRLSTLCCFYLFFLSHNIFLPTQQIEPNKFSIVWLGPFSVSKLLTSIISNTKETLFLSLGR